MNESSVSQAFDTALDKIIGDLDERQQHIVSFYCVCMYRTCSHSRKTKTHLIVEHGVNARMLDGWLPEELAEHHASVHGKTR